MNDILQAARSYYGLADTESCTTQLYTNQAGQACVAFEIALSNEDFAAIVQRMQNMQQPDTQPDTAIIEGPTVGAMRESYNALSKAEKGRYGSFARYMAESSGGIVEGGYREGAQRVIDALMPKPARPAPTMPECPPARKVIHVDAPEEPEPVSMDAVWLDEEEATQAQKQFAIDYCENDGYYVQWAMLTEEQRQKAKEAKL